MSTPLRRDCLRCVQVSHTLCRPLFAAFYIQQDKTYPVDVVLIHSTDIRASGKQELEMNSPVVRPKTSPSIHSEWSGPRALLLCEALMGTHLDGSQDERTITVDATARQGTWHQTTAIQE